MLEKMIYMNLAAVPLYLIILFATVYRKMIKGRTNGLYLTLTALAFLTVASELVARFAMRELPMSAFNVGLTKAAEYIYFIVRNGTNLIYMFFIFSVTRTWYRIRPIWKKMLLTLPYLIELWLLAGNERTGYVFTVTAGAGYERGTHIWVLYILAGIYFAVGISYLTLCRKALNTATFITMTAMYLSNLLAVLIQMVYPRMLIECYFTSISILFVLLFVQRPEEQVDVSTGLPAYRAFCDEMKKISLTGQHVQIIIVSITNAAEVKRFLGEDAYFTYIHTISDVVNHFAEKSRLAYDLFFEQPGNFYIMTDDLQYNPVQDIPSIRDKIRKDNKNTFTRGALPDVRMVKIDYPDDLKEVDELIRFGHSFTRFANVDRIYAHAKDITSIREYQIEAHMDEILERALNSNGLIAEYLPIVSTEDEKKVAIDIRVRLHDAEYGDIDGTLLRKAAGARGLSHEIGQFVMDAAFAYAGSEEFEKNGYEYVNILLSVTQFMQLQFTDVVWSFREKYNVHPEKICFSVMESAYENMSGVLDENLNKLSMQGYKLALDGYGNEYTNIQHILKMPLKYVRLDESMLRNADTGEGRAVLKGTIELLKNINLSVIGCGARDEKDVRLLKELGCGFISSAGAF